MISPSDSAQAAGLVLPLRLEDLFKLRENKLSESPFIEPSARTVPDPQACKLPAPVIECIYQQGDNMTQAHYDEMLAVLATAPNDDRGFEAWLDAITVEHARRQELAALPPTDRKRANSPRL